MCEDFALSTRELSKLEQMERDGKREGGWKTGNRGLGDSVAYNKWRAAGIVAPAVGCCCGGYLTWMNQRW